MPSGYYSWRRIAIALFASLLIHIAIGVSLIRDYRAVADRAVSFEVLEQKPEPPPAAPPSAAEKKPEQQPLAEEKPKQPEPKPFPKPEAPAIAKVEAKSEILNEQKDTDSIAGDAGPSDAGPHDGGEPADGGQAVAEAGADAGAEGEGICMHDLFPFAPSDSSWVLWISLASFRKTAYQDEIGNTLRSFGLDRRMLGSAKIDPAEEVEGLIVTARDVLDWQSYGAVLTSTVEESELKKRLGQSGTGGGSSFNWRMVGSGKVLSIGGRAGQAVPQDTETDTGSPSGGTGANDVKCISAASSPKEEILAGKDIDESVLLRLARAYISPDPQGHWPVAVLATRDPKAIGLGRGYGKGAGSAKFKFALLRAYFRDPITIEGTVGFDGSIDGVAAVAEEWRGLAASAARDPLLAMAGMGSFFDGLEIKSSGTTIDFALKTTEGKAKAALLFLQIQADALTRRSK